MHFKVQPKSSLRNHSQRWVLINLPKIKQKPRFLSISSANAAKIFIVHAAVSFILNRGRKSKRRLNKLKHQKKKILISRTKKLYSRIQRRISRSFAKNVRMILLEDIAKIVSNICVKSAVSRFITKEKELSMLQIQASSGTSWSGR